MSTTRLSSKGQVVLPRTTRARRNWPVGTELEVIDTDDGVLLRPLSPFKPTRVQDVAGMASYRGPRRSIEDMDRAVLEEAAKHK